MWILTRSFLFGGFCKHHQVHQTKQALQRRVTRQKILIDKLLGEKRVLRQKVRRLQAKVEKMEADHVQELSKMRDATFDASRRTKNPRGWLTPSGNIAVAIRRNIGNTACALLGHVILSDISASSVARAEIRTGAALVSHTKGFYEMCRYSFRHANMKVQDSLDESQTSSTSSATSGTALLAVHAFRQDATNSGVWKRSKLAAMELETFYTDGQLEFHICRLADVQRVVDGTAKGTVAMTLKQMESLGCPTWSELRQPSSTYFNAGWNVFMQTTDRGPNELAARNLNSALYDCGPRVIYMDFDCQEHATHLCVMAGLGEADSMLDFKYFANCAVLANVLRDVSQLLFPTWRSLFGVADALKNAKRLFPKCISGRWGSIHDFELRCLECNGSKLSMVLKQMLEEKVLKKSKGETTESSTKVS